MNKADAPADDGVHRLTDMDTQFVSLVRAGANRQTKFFVVKEDGSAVPPVEDVKDGELGLGPGGQCVCTKCGHSVAHVTGEKCSDLKCPECGGDMTRKDEPEKEEPTGGTPPATETTDGGAAPVAETKLELSAWLEAAGARVEALTMECAIDAALSAPPPPAAAAAVGKMDVPAVEPVEKRVDLAKIEELEGEIEKQRAEIEKIRTEAKDAIRKAEHALAAEKAKVAKLRQPIAQPSALRTGETPASGGAKPMTLWPRDLSKAVRDEEDEERK